MKRIILILTAIFIANVVVASSEVTANSSEKVIRVAIDNVAQNASVQLQDSKGEIVHSETVTKQNFTGKYDVSQLPDGVYTLTVKETEEKFITFNHFNITIDQGLTFVDLGLEERVFMPSFQQKGEFLLLNILSLNKDTYVVVRFADAQGNAVHTDSFTAKASKGRAYSIAELLPGTYTATCFIEGQEIVQSFTVK